MPYHPYTIRPHHTCPNDRPHCANELFCEGCGRHICADEHAYNRSVEERYDQEPGRVTGVRFVSHILCYDCYWDVR